MWLFLDFIFCVCTKKVEIFRTLWNLSCLSCLYFQGVLVFLAAKSGLIENTDEAAKFQDFILCIEMLIAAVGHLFAFPYKEYAGANIGGSRGLTGSLAHALKLNDFYHDTVHQVSKHVISYLATVASMVLTVPISDIFYLQSWADDCLHFAVCTDLS